MRHPLLTVTFYRDDERGTFVAVAHELACEVEAESSLEAMTGLVRMVREIREGKAAE